MCESVALPDTVPRVSVIMSVHNEENWLVPAIESILNQTFQDLELRITDDGSSDGSRDILCHFQKQDPRVRLIRHEKKNGLAVSLNEQIRQAGGEYIARMDGDDMAHSERIESQVDFLDSHPEVALLGTYCNEIDKNGNKISLWKRPVTDQALRAALLYYNPFVHSTVMLRREVFKEAGYYNPKWRYAQDYDLWLRISRSYKMANLMRPLVDLRVDWDKLEKKNTEARRCEFNILLSHFRTCNYPLWRYLHLWRTAGLALFPTPITMRLKHFQRHWRKNRTSFFSWKQP